MSEDFKIVGRMAAGIGGARMTFADMIKELDDMTYSLIVMSLTLPECIAMASQCQKISQSLEEWQQVLEDDHK